MLPPLTPVFLSLLYPLQLIVDTVESFNLFTSIIVALITIAGSVIAVAIYLKKSVNKTNTDFIASTKEYLDNFRKDINSKLESIQKSGSKELDQKLQAVTNIIVEKSNSQKDALSDLKNTVQHFDNKLDQTGQKTAIHETVLNEHGRRLDNIEDKVNKFYTAPVFSNDSKRNINPYGEQPYDSNETETVESN